MSLVAGGVVSEESERTLTASDDDFNANVGGVTRVGGGSQWEEKGKARAGRAEGRAGES